MEESIAEAVLTPWWKIPVYIVTTAFSVIAVKVTFDVNAWLKERGKARERKERQELCRKCHHVWTLFPDFPLSRCNKCLALIDTTILLNARDLDPGNVFIFGVVPGMSFTTGEGEIYSSDYQGGRE